MLCPHPPGGKHLPTLITWEFFTTVYSHVNHQAVVGFERLLAHWTVFPISGYSMNLVWDLCDFPGLGSLAQVLPTKKSQHLLLDPFQGSLLHYHFIISRARLWWHRNLSWSTKSSSGYPGSGRQTLSLSLACQPNYLDTFRTEHSNTNFSNLVLAMTEKTASHSFTYSFIFPRQNVSLIHALMQSFTCFHQCNAGCNHSPSMSLVQSLIHALMQSFTCFHQCNAGCNRSPSMSLVQSLVHIYKAKPITHSYVHPYVPAALKQFMALYVMMISSFSIILSCLI